MTTKWLNLFFQFSGYVFALKQKIVAADSWIKAALYAVLLLVVELGFIVISLPMYILVPPKKVQEDGKVFPGKEKKTRGRGQARLYILRRKISLATIFSAGGIFLFKVLFIGIVSFYLLGAQPLLADSQDWTFSTPADYTTSSANIEITGGVAQLKDIGSTTTGSTTNSGFTADATGWTYADWTDPGSVTVGGARQTSGGNTGAYVDVNIAISGSGSVNRTGAGYWRQQFTTTVASPDTATLNLDWKSITFTAPSPPATYKLYAFIDTTSGVPSLGTEVWSSGEITATTNWASIPAVDITGKISVAGTYYLKIAAYATSPLATGSYVFNSGFDNVIVNWSKTTHSYDATKPTIYPVNSLTMPKAVSWNSFTETATKNGGEIYYQLSADNGSSWNYWNGSAWATAGATNYNIATDVNANISTFSTSTNQIKWKAFLSGNGSQQVILDNIAIGYTQNQAPTIANLSSAQNTQYGYAYVNYNLLDAESDPSSLVTYEYSLTGAFAGEQITMTASTTDPSHSGVSNLAASPAGLAHTFIWDALAQVGNIYSESAYVRVRANDGIQSGAYALSSAFTIDYVLPVIANVTSTEVLTTTTVQISYDLTDNTADNLAVELQASGDGGATWDVPVTSVSGAVGSGVTAGAGKIINWNVGADYPGQQKNNMRVRVRARDKWQNQAGYTASTDFALDTTPPVNNIQANLLSQPNAGDTTALIGGSFTEVNPSTNTFYADINGAGYSSGTNGTANTASPANQATTVTALTGNDYVSKVKIIHADKYGQTVTNENTTPNTAYKYVKPYTPLAPTLADPITTNLNLTINPHASESANVQYAIFETTQNKYVQADGTLGDAAAWGTLGTGSGQWGNNTAVSGKVHVTGLSSPLANYIFKVKSRNPNDTAHAASSESAFSATAQITNTVPAIAINSNAQTTDGTDYVAVAITGTDGQGDISSLSTYQYSTDNTNWFTMTEKTGVGSGGTSNLVFLPTGSSYNFMWDSGTDLPSAENDTTRVRFTPNDSLSDGTQVTSNAFSIDNKAPVISNVVSAQGIGARVVAVTYDLTDHNNSTVILEASSDGGSNWTVPTASATGAVGAGITSGTGKTISWNVGVDYNGQYNTGMRVRLRATDSKGNAGAYTQSGAFTVDTRSPVVSNVTAAQDAGADTFAFQYDVSEDAGNVNVILEISSNSGSTWTVATSSATGAIGAGITPGTGKSITWNGATNYNNQEKTGMRIRITATDQYTNEANNSSSDFSLDTYAPRVTAVSAGQTSGATNVVITYTLADQNTSLTEIDISEDGGSSWTVADTNVSGDIGGGITAGSKTVTWAAGTDFDEQQQLDLRVRVRAKDTYNHQGADVESANFALDTKNPTANVLADLLSEPNAGDTTVLIGGSFVESNPNTNNFYVALNGGSYGSATAGSTNTASPSNQTTSAGTTLNGGNYISKVKVTHTDDFGQTYDNENLTPAAAYKYVKPYTPQAPTVDNPTVGTVDVLINPHASETTGLEYAIFETSQAKYVQSDGTLGVAAVWQTLGTGDGQWGRNSGVSGKVMVNGLATHSYLYQFQVKSRNTSDTAHAVTSESALSSGASSANQSPTIGITSVGQSTDGTKFVTINYTGTDLESETSNLVKYQYSTDNSIWQTMTEKSGVGSDGASALAFTAGGTAHDFMWDVAADLANTEDNTVYVRLQANDGTSDGGIAASSAITVDTKNPVVSAVAGAQTADSNNVIFTYTLTDISNSNVELDISEDSGFSWAVTDANVSGDVGAGISSGAGKSITWNAGLDFDDQEQNDLMTRIRALDAYGNQGSYAQSANFSLDTKNPVVSNVSAVQNSGLNTVNITYDLADANNSTVAMDISDDGGFTWTVTDMSVTGDIGSGITPGTGKTITWSAGADFSGQDQADLRVRVRAADTYANLSGNVESANFSLDTLAPAITNVVVAQTVGSTTVAITYNLVDSGLVNVAIDISADSGATWSVTDVSTIGAVGAGVAQGTGKTITWDAGVDFDEQQQSDLRVRVRGTDTFNNTSASVESADFALDTLNPTTNVAANLQSQPNAGDTTALIGGSFTEANPNVNNFYVAINGGAYGGSSAGDANTATPANKATAVGTTLKGNDYISKVKIAHTDDFGQSVDNENTSPDTAYKYVKPYTPPAPTVANAQNTSVDVAVNANTNEATSVQYAIFENLTSKYVQANGTLGVSAVWQTTSTWATITVTGLTSPVAQYSFKVKARNPSDAAHAASSESDFSAVGAITNTAPSISITSASQVGGNNYAVINYTGTDAQNDTNNITAYQYSTDNTNWFTMTEKSGVGSNGVNNLIFASIGSAYNFAWDISTDLPNTQDATVYARLQSTDGITGSSVVQSSAFAVDTLGPVISNINVSQTAGTSLYTIHYDLADQSATGNNVLVQVSANSGSTWVVPTTTLSGDFGVNVTAGTGKTVIWDAGTDYNNQENNTMQVRVRGTDTYNNTGSFVSSSDFTADTKGPVVSGVSASQTVGSGNVVINYSIADITAGGIFVDFAVSSDGGTNWDVVASTYSGDVGSGVATGARSITWNAGADFAAQYSGTMKVRVRGRDYYNNQGSYANSANFAVDAKVPVISSVVASQTAGSKVVDVTYNLADDSTSDLMVQMDISENNGTSWTVATSTMLGNIGTGQSTGNEKSISWDAGVDFPGQYNTGMKVRLQAVDKYANQNNFTQSSAFTVDTNGPVISNVSASQTSGANSVSVNYDLAENTTPNIIVALDISSDGGSSWTVATTTLAGNIGTGQSAGTGKTVTWNAGTDFSGNYNTAMQVRVRGMDSFTNVGSYANSANFAVDTKNPIVLTASDLQSQPNAGDTTALIGGSFIENNPNTNNFYVAVIGGSYGGATAGSAGTATPADQDTATGVTLKGSDYISKVKIVHTDSYNNSATNENTDPNTAYKYVKPYQPAALTVDNPQATTVDITVNKNPAEVSGLEYAIYSSSTAQYVQANGSLGANAVWQPTATWGTITVTGLSSPVANYIFFTKSRNSSDAAHAATSESIFSPGALAGDLAPVITIDSASQVAGNNYVMINYTGVDADNNTVNLVKYQYSLDNSTWFDMTEKSGVGSNGKINLPFTAAGAALKFAWDANTDLSNLEDGTVYLRLQGNDAILDGNLAVSPSFALDLNAPRISNVSSSQQSGSSSVSISYDIADITAANISVALDISSDNGSTWTVATSTILGNIGAGQTAGSNKTITWNVGVDFNNQFSAGLVARLRAIDSFNNQSGNTLSSAFSVDTLGPIVSAVATSQTSNIVTVTYNLADDTGAGLSTYLDISANNGTSWTVATSTVLGNIGTGQTTGIGKSVTWNVGTDFNNQYSNQMMARVRAVDSYSNQGSFASSPAFAVDTKGPVISNVSAVQNSGSGNVEVTYFLTDDSSSNNSAQFQISADGGATWTVSTTTYSGSINQSVSTGTSTFTWNAGVDFNGQEKTNMRAGKSGR